MAGQGSPDAGRSDPFLLSPPAVPVEGGGGGGGGGVGGPIRTTEGLLSRFRTLGASVYAPGEGGEPPGPGRTTGLATLTAAGGGGGGGVAHPAQPRGAGNAGAGGVAAVPPHAADQAATSPLASSGGGGGGASGGGSSSGGEYEVLLSRRFPEREVAPLAGKPLPRFLSAVLEAVDLPRADKERLRARLQEELAGGSGGSDSSVGGGVAAGGSVVLLRGPVRVCMPAACSLAQLGFEVCVRPAEGGGDGGGASCAAANAALAASAPGAGARLALSGVRATVRGLLTLLRGLLALPGWAPWVAQAVLDGWGALACAHGGGSGGGAGGAVLGAVMMCGGVPDVVAPGCEVLVPSPDAADGGAGSVALVQAVVVDVDECVLQAVVCMPPAPGKALGGGGTRPHAPPPLCLWACMIDWLHRFGSPSLNQPSRRSFSRGNARTQAPPTLPPPNPARCLHLHRGSFGWVRAVGRECPAPAGAGGPAGAPRWWVAHLQDVTPLAVGLFTSGVSTGAGGGGSTGADLGGPALERLLTPALTQAVLQGMQAVLAWPELSALGDAPHSGPVAGAALLASRAVCAVGALAAQAPAFARSLRGHAGLLAALCDLAAAAPREDLAVSLSRAAALRSWKYCAPGRNDGAASGGGAGEEGEAAGGEAGGGRLKALEVHPGASLAGCGVLLALLFCCWDSVAVVVLVLVLLAREGGLWRPVSVCMYRRTAPRCPPRWTRRACGTRCG
jgi:hypothetical protein